MMEEDADMEEAAPTGKKKRWRKRRLKSLSTNGKTTTVADSCPRPDTGGGRTVGRRSFLTPRTEQRGGRMPAKPGPILGLLTFARTDDSSSLSFHTMPG